MIVFTMTMESFYIEFQVSNKFSSYICIEICNKVDFKIYLNMSAFLLVIKIYSIFFVIIINTNLLKIYFSQA